MATCNRKELTEVLTAASVALKTSEIKERSYFWFIGEHVYAYDGGFGVRLKLPVELGFDCGVPGKALLDLLKTSVLDQVFLDLVGTDLVIQMGKAKVKLASLSAERWAWLFPDKIKGQVTNLQVSTAMLEALDQVKISRAPAAKADHRAKQGVIASEGEDGHEFYALEGTTLARRVLKGGSFGLSDFILPWQFVVDGVLGFAKAKDTIYLAKGYKTTVGKDVRTLNFLMLEGKDYRVFSNMLEFPEGVDLRKIVADHLGEGGAVELPTTLAQVLERATILAGSEPPYVTLEAGGKTLIVSGRWPLGSIDEKLTLKADAGKASGVFPIEGITRGLKLAGYFKLTGKSVVLLDAESDAAFVYVIGAKETAAKLKTEKKVEADEPDTLDTEPEEGEPAPEERVRPRAEKRRGRR